jgi:hypothetical protein
MYIQTFNHNIIFKCQLVSKPATSLLYQFFSLSMGNPRALYTKRFLLPSWRAHGNKRRTVSVLIFLVHTPSHKHIKNTKTIHVDMAKRALPDVYRSLQVKQLKERLVERGETSLWGTKPHLINRYNILTLCTCNTIRIQKKNIFHATQTASNTFFTGWKSWMQLKRDKS